MGDKSIKGRSPRLLDVSKELEAVVEGTRKVKSIDPSEVRKQRKRKQKSATEQFQKRMMTEDYAYTDKFNTKGPHSRVAEATAKGVRITRRGGGMAGMRRFNRGGKV